jgi:hypothetical protein
MLARKLVSLDVVVLLNAEWFANLFGDVLVMVPKRSLFSLMNVIRQGPQTPYTVECTHCDSLIEFEKLDLIEFDIYTGDYTQYSTEARTGLCCPVCVQKFWTPETNKMTAITKVDK